VVVKKSGLGFQMGVVVEVGAVGLSKQGQLGCQMGMVVKMGAVGLSNGCGCQNRHWWVLKHGFLNRCSC
jgi:hypothetical protein